jgi:hypothetical protein
MKVRVRKEISVDGWHHWIIETKKYSLFGWKKEGHTTVSPFDENSDELAKKMAINFAKNLINPIIVEVTK